MNMENTKCTANNVKELIDNAIVNFLAKNTKNAKEVIIDVSTLSQSVRENIENNGYCVIFSKLHNYVFAPLEYPFITYPWNLVSCDNTLKEALVQCEIMAELTDLVDNIFRTDNSDWRDWHHAKYDWNRYRTFMTEVVSQTVDHQLPKCFSEFLCCDTSLDMIIDSINEIDNAIKQNQLDDSIELCGEYIDLAEVAETGCMESCGDGYDTFGDDSDITETLQYFFAAYLTELTGAKLVKYSDLVC